ncbi:succinate dehydrogenase assembly factor 2 [Pandoraea sp. NPDC087047]|uniref:FAD assembly factor SdhE n=1 Tax=Pandoraea sp. NPDC087047 TaxID=3364390 RepID=UPI0037FAF023
MPDTTHQSDPVKRARLRWRARRGLLENDLILERFFAKYEASLTDGDVGALTKLLDLSDNDLMDLLLARKEPEADLDGPDVRRLLALLRAV